MARYKPLSAPVDAPSPARDAAVAHGLPNLSPSQEDEVRRISRQVRRYVRRDIVEQRAAVENLMIEGAGLRQIARILRTSLDPDTNLPRWPNITVRTVRMRMEQVNVQRREEVRHDRATMREHAIERLHSMRQRALAKKDPDFKSAIACEREIAKLGGLYMPVKFEVDGSVHHAHQVAMVNVISNMDEDQARELLEEARTEKRLAAKARELLPSIIDVEPETDS